MGIGAINEFKNAMIGLRVLLREIRDALNNKKLLHFLTPTIAATLERMETLCSDENVQKIQKTINEFAGDDGTMARLKENIRIMRGIALEVQETILPQLSMLFDDICTILEVLLTPVRFGQDVVRFTQTHPYITGGATIAGTLVCAMIGGKSGARGLGKLISPRYSLPIVGTTGALIYLGVQGHHGRTGLAQNNQLLQAAIKNNLDAAMAALESGARLTATDNSLTSDGWNALHWAVWHGNEKMIDAILNIPECRVLINERTAVQRHGSWFFGAGNGGGHTVFHILNRTTYSNDKKERIERKLISHGAENRPDAHGNRAMLLSAASSSAPPPPNR